MDNPNKMVEASSVVSALQELLNGSSSGSGSSSSSPILRRDCRIVIVTDSSSSSDSNEKTRKAPSATPTPCATPLMSTLPSSANLVGLDAKRQRRRVTRYLI